MLNKSDLNKIQSIVKIETTKIIQDSFKVFWDDVLEPMFNKILGRLDKVEGRLNKVEKRLDKVEYHLDKVVTNQRDMKRQLNDLKLDSPTRKEFSDLKIRVDRIESIAS